jgi:hypothetical protein
MLGSPALRNVPNKGGFWLLETKLKYKGFFKKQKINVYATLIF